MSKIKKDISLVLLPSIGYKAVEWSQVHSLLKELGYRVYSPSFPVNKSLDEYVDFVFGYLNKHHLQKEIFLVGQSMGGVISLKTAYKYPRMIKGLVLTSVPIRNREDYLPDLWRGVTTIFSIHKTLSEIFSFLVFNLWRFSNLIGGFRLSDKLGLSNASVLHGISAQAVARDLLEIWDTNIFDISKIVSSHTPMLIMYGAKDFCLDTMSGFKHYHEIEANKVLRIDEGAHGITTEFPEIVAKNINEFVESIIIDHDPIQDNRTG